MIRKKNPLEVSNVFYTDFECELKKNRFMPEKPYTQKKSKHKPTGYSLVACCSFDSSKTMQKYYRGKDCMEKFCDDLKYQTMKIINYEKKKEIARANEEKESYEKQRECCICEERVK